MNSTTWTITRRITAGLGVLLLMLVLISALALVRIASLRSSVGGLADEALPSVVLLGEVVTPWMVGCALVIVVGTALSTGLITLGRKP